MDILIFKSDFSQVVSATVPISANTNSYFTVSLDLTNAPYSGYFQWGFEMSGYPIPAVQASQYGYVLLNNNPLPCFKEDTKILTDKGYIAIRDLKKGDRVKTLNHDFVPVHMIGKKIIHNIPMNDRNKEQLYVCSSSEYPEVFEDLVITGGHSILVDDFKEGQRDATTEILGNIYVTDNKYRLPVCVDNRSKTYEKNEDVTIYHIALENDDYYENYGIYANGLLVETCSKRYLKEFSDMEVV